MTRRYAHWTALAPNSGSNSCRYKFDLARHNSHSCAASVAVSKHGKGAPAIVDRISLRVTALPRVIEVDGVLAPTTLPAMSGNVLDRCRLGYRMAPTAISMKIDIHSDLVGDTGIEPVTSSV